MSRRIELPHTAGCLVCGRSNAMGLHLSLSVDLDNDTVHTRYTPRPADIGFDGIIHGGMLCTVLDETMVWAAIWASKRSCVAAEINVRFKESAAVGVEYLVSATTSNVRSRLIECSGTITDPTGRAIALATGKFSPLSERATLAFAQTLLDEPATHQALAHIIAV